MIDIHALARPFESWNAMYSHSKVLSTAVTTLHVGAMFIGGGLAMAADRTTLRIAAEQPDERTRQLAEISDIHRPVTIAIVVLFITGIAMTLADLENFLTSPVFWIKIMLVTLLLVNGVLLQRSEAALRRSTDGSAATPTALPRWHQLRKFSVLSVTLWIATFLAGSILTNAA